MNTKQIKERTAQLMNRGADIEQEIIFNLLVSYGKSKDRERKRNLLKAITIRLITLEEIADSLEPNVPKYSIKSRLEGIYNILDPNLKQEIEEIKRVIKDEEFLEEFGIDVLIHHNQRIPTKKDGEVIYNEYLEKRDILVISGLLIKEDGEYKIDPTYDDVPF